MSAYRPTGFRVNNPNSFIHSRYFYGVSSSPLLLRGAPESRHSTDTVSESHTEAPHAIASEGLTV